MLFSLKIIPRIIGKFGFPPCITFATLEGDGLRDAKILDDILDGKLDDLDDNGEEAELALVIGDDVLPDDDDDESISEIDGVEYTTVVSAALSEHIIRHVGHIVTGLLQDAKMQTFTAVSQQQTAWHTTAWAYIRSITLERTVNIMRSILTPGAARAFTQKEITIPVLAKHLRSLTYDCFTARI